MDVTELSIEQIQALLYKHAENSFPEFARQMNNDFVMSQFHKTYYSILQLFAERKIKKLIVSVPSQHGKSEGSTRLLPPFIFGKHPDTRMIISSYNNPFTFKFNRQIQRYIDSSPYKAIFPETTLNSSRVATDTQAWLRNSHEFEIVGKKGSLIAAGRGSGVSGNPVDVYIMDDLYKDMKEGNSPVVRAAVIEWYTSAVMKRLHNDSQQLIVFTRWHEEDLIGYLEKNQEVIEVTSIKEALEINDRDPDIWVKINFQAIKEGPSTELDPRKKGEALWPYMHSVKKHKAAKALDPIMFECMDQGNPSSGAGRLYKPFKTYESLPRSIARNNYTDTADKGTDYFCSIDYEVGADEYIRVIDVEFTMDDMDNTSETMPARLNMNNIRLSRIESNNGGRAFSILVRKKARRCVIDPIPQRDNKESRVLTNAPMVNERILFPEDWQQRWPDFYTHVSTFKRQFNANSHDDGPDVLTAIIEHELLEEVAHSRRGN